MSKTEPNYKKFLNRKNNTPDIDSDFIIERRLSNIESTALMIQDVNIDEEELEKAIEQYVKWR
jgi:hypothetical protein